MEKERVIVDLDRYKELIDCERRDKQRRFNLFFAQHGYTYSLIGGFNLNYPDIKDITEAATILELETVIQNRIAEVEKNALSAAASQVTHAKQLIEESDKRQKETESKLEEADKVKHKYLLFSVLFAVTDVLLIIYVLLR